MNLALLHSRTKVSIRQGACVLFAALFGKGEDDNREQRSILEVVE